MLRHWREIDRVVRATHPPSIEIACPLGAPPDDAAPSGRLIRAWKKYVEYPLRVRLARGADVVHVLDHSFAHLLRFAPRGSRKIVTVHDLAPLEDDTLSPTQRQRFRRTLSWLNDADLLLCDSEFTAKALRSFLTHQPRIAVHLLGVNASAFAAPHELPGSIAWPAVPRLLSIGSALPRKNLDLLPAILEEVVREVGAVALVRVGARLPPELRRRIEAIVTPSRLLELGHASEHDLIAIYQNCDLLIFPSTLEGFGLPLLEAMAAGCPVVSSSASSLPEVGSDAVLYFDPADPHTAATQIVKILRGGALRASLIERGRLRARELAWEQHVLKLCEYYRE